MLWYFPVPPNSGMSSDRFCWYYPKPLPYSLSWYKKYYGIKLHSTLKLREWNLFFAIELIVGHLLFSRPLFKNTLENGLENALQFWTLESQNSKSSPKNPSKLTHVWCGEANMGMKMWADAWCMSHIVIACKQKNKKNKFAFINPFMEKIQIPLIFTRAWNGPNPSHSLIQSGHLAIGFRP